MPTNVETTNYSFGSVAFDNAPYLHVSLEKQLSAAGRIFESDEFRIRQGNGTVAATTATGAGAAPYSYTPDASGFDPNVTGLQVNPAGMLAASNGSNDPSFTISFEDRVN